MRYLNRGLKLMFVALLLVLSSTASAAGHSDISTTMMMATTTPSMTTTPLCSRPGKLPTKLAAKCWLAIFEVPACVFEIAEAFEGGSIFKLTRSCCRAFIDLTDDCKIEVFEHSKWFPVVDNFCVAIGGGGSDPHSPPPHSL